jgi:uncharacterized protein YebE (UPF0316 family)
METFPFELIIVALLIFVLQATNITVGTLRVMMLVRGNRLAAGGLALLESSVWIYAAGQVINDLGNPFKVVAYVSGFAVGTMVGVTVERWLALGKALLRIIAPVDSPQVVDELRKRGYYATVLNATGRDGDVRVVFSVVPRKQIRAVEQLVAQVNPQAFVTFEETRTMSLMRAHMAVPQGAMVTLAETLGNTDRS